MRKLLKVLLLVTNIISFVLVLLFGASGIVYELFGPANYEKMLQKLNISWDLKHILLFMYLCLIVLIVTYVVRKKYFNE